MSDQLFERAVREWLEDGSDRTPRPAIDAVLLAVKTTPQERDLRIPRRFNPMTTSMRLAAGLAIVAVLGVGAFLYLGQGPDVGNQPTTSPVPSPSGEAATSTLPLGITGWTTYTSAVHGFTMRYPADWSVQAPATRKWQAGDAFPGDAWPYADAFVSPGEDDASIGLFVWEMPAGEGADLESVAGLKAWAETFCNEVGASGCDAFTQGALPECQAVVIDPGVVECRAALLVPTAGPQFAFFPDWTSLIFTGIPDAVTVVAIGREDSFPPAARYGGSVELLKSILTTMGVWTPGQQPRE